MCVCVWPGHTELIRLVPTKRFSTVQDQCKFFTSPGRKWHCTDRKLRTSCNFGGKFSLHDISVFMSFRHKGKWNYVVRQRKISNISEFGILCFKVYSCISVLHNFLQSTAKPSKWWWYYVRNLKIDTIGDFYNMTNYSKKTPAQRNGRMKSVFTSDMFHEVNIRPVCLYFQRKIPMFICGVLYSHIFRNYVHQIVLKPLQRQQAVISSLR